VLGWTGVKGGVVMEQMGMWHDDWFLRLLLRLYRMVQVQTPCDSGHLSESFPLNNASLG